MRELYGFNKVFSQELWIELKRHMIFAVFLHEKSRRRGMQTLHISNNVELSLLCK